MEKELEHGIINQDVFLLNQKILNFA